MRLPLFKRPSPNRSKNMRAIRSRRNKSTELRLVALLRENHIRGWRRHPSNILGSPDILFRRRRLAVFVDGCFFHGCPRCGHIPKTNKAYWATKISRNRERDLQVSRKLRTKGFRVIRIRECRLKKSPERCVSRILRCLKARK